jgi:hypothetical protein
MSMLLILNEEVIKLVSVVYIDDNYLYKANVIRTERIILHLVHNKLQS